MKRREITCGVCLGSGTDPDSLSRDDCWNCGGLGKVSIADPEQSSPALWMVLLLAVLLLAAMVAWVTR
jgi:hypothetical protein